MHLITKVQAKEITATIITAYQGKFYFPRTQVPQPCELSADIFISNQLARRKSRATNKDQQFPLRSLQ